MRNYLNEHGDSLTIRKVRADIDYVNEAIWTARDKRSGERSVIGGPLAQILEKYPKDYALQGPFCWSPFTDEPSTVLGVL